jgi:hypothetical protein
MMKTQREIRQAFWASHPSHEAHARATGTRSKPQNEQHTLVRCAFVDYVDYLRRDGQISEAMADKVTL